MLLLRACCRSTSSSEARGVGGQGRTTAGHPHRSFDGEMTGLFGRDQRARGAAGPGGAVRENEARPAVRLGRPLTI